ncbi:MAG: hypothetical protein MI725_00155, partial [Pirellulales bacterium]|nr:hypothetical protein [Pirellulales bacterium]
LNFTVSNSSIAVPGVGHVDDFLPGTTDFQGLVELSSSNSKLHAGNVGGTDTVDLKINFTGFPENTLSVGNYTMVADFFSFGQTGDGFLPSDRINNAIYRLELEESGDNTGIFVGTMEFIMLNQINVNDTDTYSSGIESITDGIELIVGNDLTDEDSVRVNYFDVDDTGVPTAVSDQIEAPTHSGIVSFDQNNYKVGDLTIVTLEDSDLNTDVETIDVFTVVDTALDPAIDTVGASGYGENSFGDAFGRLLDITFDDELWVRNTASTCPVAPTIPEDNGLGSTGFTLIETGVDTGILEGTFLIPTTYCQAATGELKSVTGTDMEVNYVDYRDASGEIIEVGDGAGIRANTGSVSLDRTVYPVPFGVPADFGGPGTTSTPSARSVFPVHQTGMGGATAGLDAGEFLA